MPSENACVIVSYIAGLWRQWHEQCCIIHLHVSCSWAFSLPRILSL